MFKPVSRRPNHREIEQRILKFWDAGHYFKRLLERNRGNEQFRFLDGPITANNPMGVHHAWGRAYKDLFQRYKAMLGYDQRFQNGFDCQGLWVEVEVEKELGFKSKRDIEKFGIDSFVQKCKERVLKYSKIQTEQSVRLGQWMDWENSYYTMSDENNYSIWHFLKKCHERGLIYEGTDVMPWCPRCGTAISDMEIATEGYQELTHKAVFLRFPLRGHPNEYLLVWTTTPWTLTSNVAVAVHPDLIYVRAKKDGRVYIVAKPLLEVLGTSARVIEEKKGNELVGLRYLGPFDELSPQHGVDHRVIPWDEVNALEGTGLVHIAPGCGKEDFDLGKEHGLKAIAPLNEDGTFKPEFGWLAGKDAKTASEPIFENLKGKGYLYRVEGYTHRYPVCWRCGEELLFRLVDEWFINMDALRSEIMDSAREVRWIPQFGLSRELDWLKNMADWCISKKRYWGLALPIYRCECGWFDVIGSAEELKARAVEGWDKFSGHTPHRPWIDEVKIKCEKCGRTVSRIKDVGNPWLDAGIVPFSTAHYLVDRNYWQKWFPFDFITECFPGQFRNWFYAILAMSTVLEKHAPFKVLLGHALVKDEKGQDMHKSAGNAISVDEAVDKIGADVMRWIYLSQNPTQNLLFGFGKARDVERKLLTFWNVYSFFVTYANIDKINPNELKLKTPHLSLLDQWILSRLNSLVRLTRERLDDFNPLPVPHAIEAFVEDLSTWYVRRSRRRFWKSASDRDKQTAYQTLYTCIVTLTKLIAPFMPFLSEDIYQNIVRSVNKSAPESVHLCQYPEPIPSFINTGLEQEVILVRNAVSLGRAAREKTKLKVRQPLSAAIVRPERSDEQNIFLRHADAIKEELNVRELLFTEPGAQFPPDYAVAEQDNLAVGINTKLTRELENEGFAREFIRKVQNLRKAAGFEVTDRIQLHYETTERLAEAITSFKDRISLETLALNITGEAIDCPDINKSLKVNGEPARLALKCVGRKRT
ncbi:isoleucine--tRNA ligase [candidate division WOR-3 bacterium JGI_Cruoil_03_51_56]|uniref:Isoleucine--tRNA ligase n=1 Tax=candidate division WOR-3 bacterium JGI_Cruoil_03_51_56 TaxID=1973747 RepID=A0A235BXM9_UNCW3|nr:MAG: isoleucine--tRNA ligase [candidate division WOR-3 bacterium JGI_Cruoil_03_51_56]